ILTLLFNNAVPLAQVQVQNSLSLNQEPHFSSEVLGKAYPGDVLLIYETEGIWAQTELGWLVLDNLPLEPAAVHYSVIISSPLEIEPIGESEAVILPDTIIGVTAIFERQALVYTESAAGWAALSEIELTEPVTDLRDFVEQPAYVKVEQADIYTLPNETSSPQTFLPLGQEAVLLYQQGSWVLVRSRHIVGWSKIAQFDVGLKPVAYAETTASPINFYYPTPESSVIDLLDYQERVLVLGRDESGKWLYLRQQDGLEGWAPAYYIDIVVEELPVVKGN
ncbi:MAG: SH3 domain-containing protein, partial [Anaerolineae bacterium]|nr:SH3 domain-containing protein [Anaerolineae bacterium]